MIRDLLKPGRQDSPYMTEPPFSFTYAEQPFAELFKTWELKHDERKLDGQRTEHTLTYADSKTDIVVRCVAIEYQDFPAVEWVLYFKNQGSTNTPILADIQPLDVIFPLDHGQDCRIHHAKGSDCKVDDFAPMGTPLAPSADLRLAPRLGRSSNGTLPFFNLELKDEGVIGAIGWTGGWAATFHRDEKWVRVRAGMEETHLKLFPGEEIRTPRILLLFWERDRLNGHNLLRRFLLAHHTPRPKGNLLQAPVCNAVWGENRAHQQIAKARWWKENDIPLDYFWIDAGWHGDGVFKEDSTLFNSDWPRHVGNWWPNKTTYPNGLKPVGDALKEMGLGFVLWLEPERVFKDTYFTREHPEWLLGPIGDNYLFNLGLSEACQGLTDLISSLISEGGITCYRQDFNTDPTPFWKAADAPDRVGMSEIRHIEGLYAFWDELLARHPGLIIDNCSSGGRRIDLETISRSIPLWRSDLQCFPNFDLNGMQGQTYGLSLWVPFSTGCCDRAETYAFRSALGPGIVITTNLFEREPPPPFPVEWLRERVNEQHEMRKYFYGDYYPLTPYRLESDVWMAWQFDRPEIGEGMVQAFRREKSVYESARVNLRGLEPDARYTVKDIDACDSKEMTGSELMEKGLVISISDQPGAVIITYKKVK